ncbi:MAG: rRNA maturation RNase YbeY [Chloroflexi bacterium]|nr:rRNA maturation RNase YbeY [Chloroflexota bacterium]MDA1239966.1 rRNA maturation RNase YbeY [Chloroflexota bacterium]MQC25421.1 rRNA maturation RNase YbeY [Chloroflexota bacterium]
MPDTRYDVTIEVEDAVAGRADLAALQRLIEQALADEDVEDGTGLALIVADDEMLHALNREHRGVDAPTDVLSFGAEEGEEIPLGEGTARYVGDIVISVETAARQAEAAGITLDQELAHIVLHGVLHLLGWDHETPEDAAAMEAREERVLGPGIHASGESHIHD